MYSIKLCNLQLEIQIFAAYTPAQNGLDFHQ
jgi:hypothetical protein